MSDHDRQFGLPLNSLVIFKDTEYIWIFPSSEVLHRILNEDAPKGQLSAEKQFIVGHITEVSKPSNPDEGDKATVLYETENTSGNELCFYAYPNTSDDNKSGLEWATPVMSPSDEFVDDVYPWDNPQPIESIYLRGIDGPLLPDNFVLQRV